jgi:3-phosphoshikimate 1-carboxyvinyltransferase
MMIDYTLPLEELPDPLPIEVLRKPFDVTITPPGSKSITCRAYVLAALAKGESRIIRPLRAEDTDRLLDALCTLGAQAKWVPGETGDGSEDVLITGVAGRFPRGGTVNLGDGGTPTRFMIACACLAAEPVVVDGSKRMRERPIAEGVDMLRRLGATIEYVEQEGRLPVRVTPSESFKGGELTVGKTASSQFISAVMLIGWCLEKGVSLKFGDLPTSFAYVSLTTNILWEWDVQLQEEWWPARRETGDATDRSMHGEIRVEAERLGEHSFKVEPDASSAVYWFMAAAISSLSSASVPDMECQPDMRIFAALNHAGPALIEHRQGARTRTTVESGERWSGVLELHCEECPDGALALAAASASAEAPTTLTGLHTLRVKETDRIAALANELRKVGCTVETTEDSITIHPIPDMDKRAATVRERSDSTRADQREPLPHGRGSFEGASGSDPIIIETYNDHRMAMAFAVLGLRVPGIQIRNPACVRKSYPTFWKDFAKLYA